ncbi:MAG: BCCT family transporter [Desulfobacterales bacterium]|nr:BCCT family transporter [Desulfobacterales bacterium]
MEVTSKSPRSIPIDKPTFFFSLAVLVSISAFCALAPDSAGVALKVIREYIMFKWGWMFLVFGLFCLLGSIWVGFSKYGDIKLGDPDDKPAYNLFTWGAMVFCSACGSSVIYWSIAEPIYYLQTPPFGEALSPTAYDFAVTYGAFHWGVAWAFYALPCLPLAYYLHVRKQENLKYSQVCAEVIGQKAANGPIGKIIDAIVVFGTFGGQGPGLGLGVPFLTALTCELFNIPVSYWMNYVILAIWISIFTMSVIRGMDRGIKVLSTINIWLVFIFLGLILFLGPTVFMLDNAVDSTGILMDNIWRMLLFADPVRGGKFAANWTVFYWCWYLALLPFLAIFIARISRGRTIREFLFGALGCGFFASVIFFWIIGSYSVYLQSNEILDIVNIVNTQGMPVAMVSIFKTLPFSKVIIAILVVLYFVFLATCIDSGSYAMACVTSKSVAVDQEPATWNRLTWALVIGFMGVALLALKKLEVIKTSVIAVGFPVMFLAILTIWVLFKWMENDFDWPTKTPPRKKTVTDQD